MTPPAKAAERCPKCGKSLKQNCDFTFVCGSYFEGDCPNNRQSPDCRIAELESALARVTQERDEARKESSRLEATGHGTTCKFCGQVCDTFAGDPSLWPIFLSDDGVIFYCHVGCVQKRILERDEAVGLLRTWLDDVPPFGWHGTVRAFLARLSARTAKEQK